MLRLGYADHKRLSKVRLCNAEIKYLARSKEAENDSTGLVKKASRFSLNIVDEFFEKEEFTFYPHA